MTLMLSLGSTATHEEAYGRLTLGTAQVQGGGGQRWAVPGAGIQVQLPKRVSAIGLLEEYKFFIRPERAVPGRAQSRLVPTLSRARYYPGSGSLHPDGVIDLASDIVDLQVALAVDTVPTDGQILEIGAAPDDDEILFNYPGDTDGLSAVMTSRWADPDANLLFVRLSTVAQSDRPDREFPGATIDIVEDHDYRSEVPPSVFNSFNYSKLRKRLLQTIVEVRNLP
jgi:hypothetical protein